MNSEEISIRRMREEDIPLVAYIGSLCFSGLRDLAKGKLWIECNYRGYPRMQYFVAEHKGRVYGYILWMEKGGFRDNAVLELEQIGVHPNYRGRGIGTKLIRDSIKEMKRYLHERGSRLKLVEVTTGVTNDAQRLYEKTLGAKVECVIKDLFRSDEAIMIARDLEDRE